MNADSTETMGAFRIYDPAGGVVDSPDAHIERLSGWFAAEDPKWNTFFSYTMKVDGQVGEWVISGHTLTTTVDGEEKTVYDIADVYIEDGKIGAFWIYTRASDSQEINYTKLKGGFYLPFFLYFFKMNRQSSIDEFLNYLEERIENEDYKNSVHKITFMTTVHVIKKILGEK